MLPHLSGRFSGLWRHPDFMKLWIGQTVSEFGSHITGTGIPLTAVIVLGATPAQMGVLVAISALPVLILGLLAGVWVDRLRRRPIMIAMDLGRMALLLLIPAAALTGRLNLGLLYVVAAAAGTFTLFFDVAYRSVLPSLVERENVLEGNTKLATTDALAEIGGPALAGLLIQVISAPMAILFDALSFLFSAASLAMIRTFEPRPTTNRTTRSIWHEMIEGLRVIAHHPLLRIIATGASVKSFFGSFFGALYSLYALRDLGLSPALIGVLVAAGGVGALIGATIAGPLTRRLGPGRTLTGALLCGGLINLLMPLAGGPVIVAAGMMIAVQLIGDAAAAVYEINELTLRQTSVPDHLLGRANASMGFLAQSISPLGALIGGALATLIGVRLTLLVAVLGSLAAALWMLRSPLRRLEHYTLNVVETS